jgi:hypothetical protein
MDRLAKEGNIHTGMEAIRAIRRINLQAPAIEGLGSQELKSITMIPSSDHPQEEKAEKQT